MFVSGESLKGERERETEREGKGGKEGGGKGGKEGGRWGGREGEVQHYEYVSGEWLLTDVSSFLRALLHSSSLRDKLSNPLS